VIGIDTNILLRAFLEDDDPAQTALARKTIAANAPVFLNDVVLAEFAWACKTKFKLERTEIYRRLDAILDAPEFVVSRQEAIARAVAGFGARASDFADWLIAESNREQGCDATLTFDKDAAKRGVLSLLRA
jgi:predicted nucleic-acid-binding protein